MKLKHVLSLTMLAALAGCATQGFHQDPYAGFRSERDMIWVRCDNENPPQVAASLTGKIPLVAGHDRTLTMLANQSTPSADEKAALVLWVAHRDKCREQTIDLHDRHGFTGASSILRASFAAVRATYADLYTGSITYGEANKRLEQIQASTGQSLQSYGEALDARQAQQAELQRLSAIQMLQQWQAMRPVVTPTTTCTTQRIFNQLRTVCN